MIQVKCQVEESLPFTEFLPFQGALKERSDSDITALAHSLATDGLLMPFVVWHKPEIEPSAQINYLLDGHARYAAIQFLAESEQDSQLLLAKYPVVYVVASSIEEAKHSLLQISSSYGKITPKGLKVFLDGCPRIDVASLHIGIKIPAPGKVRLTKAEKKSAESVDAVIKLAVPKAKVEQFLNLIKGVSFVRIL
jgi:hypothetical protein